MIPLRNTATDTSPFFGVVPPTQNDYHVAIVGYGPAGAIAAHLLGSLGIRTLVVDREHGVYDKPRAIAIDHEIVRILDNMGLLDSLREHIAPFADSRHMGADGQVIRTLTMVSEPYPLGYTPTMVFSQPPFEALIRKAVSALPHVDVELGRTVFSLAQSQSGVTFNMRTASGDEYTASADYLIGCDGASSTIRDLVGIELEDLEFDEPWIVVDMLIHPGQGENLPEVSGHFCEPERPIAYISGPTNHKRWEIMLNEHENPIEMQQPDHVWSLLSRWIKPDEAHLWRAASYRFHALVARDWRKGRVFLAGDSVHQQPPILGQGMCQGVRDVSNLIWKLNAVIRGMANDSVLDTYGRERQVHARELISRIKDIGKVLCERDLDAARKRDARLLAEGNGVPLVITRQSVIPGLEDGVLVSSPGSGTLFPQPWISTGAGRTLMDKVLGHGWRLIASASNEIPLNLVALFKSLGGCVAALADGLDHPSHDGVRNIVEVEGVLADWFALQKTRFAIVRPDHYVFATAQSAAELENMLIELKSHLVPAPANIPELIGG